MRHIFRRYAALKSVAKLCRELKVQSYRTKPFTSNAGRSYGGRPFTRGHLYRILQNRVYRGEVNHKVRRIYDLKQHSKGEGRVVDRRQYLDALANLPLASARFRRWFREDYHGRPLEVTEKHLASLAGAL